MALLRECRFYAPDALQKRIDEVCGPPPEPLRHAYRPHRKYPWFCRDCGYPEHERLKHPEHAA